jgi:ABC-type transport system involved in multi-copper enzyme maturation permease subunit
VKQVKENLQQIGSELQAQPWQLWMNQIANIVRLELKKNLFTRRAIWISVLALAPALVILGHGLDARGDAQTGCSLTEDTTILAGIFQFYYMRVAIFFGCMGIFIWLFRGEVVEKTLHYHFLLPVRREVLVVGKFLVGTLTSFIFFGIGVFLSFLFMYGHMGSNGSQFVFDGPGLGHLGSYILVTFLACIGYGSMFLALSLVLKNPIIPGVIILLWETISNAMPATVQAFSMTYYLKNLCPVFVPAEGIFALFTIVAEPVAAWQAVLGLLLLSTVVVAIATQLIKTFEVSYAQD